MDAVKLSRDNRVLDSFADVATNVGSRTAVLATVPVGAAFELAVSGALRHRSDRRGPLTTTAVPLSARGAIIVI